MKKWQISEVFESSQPDIEQIIKVLLKNRSLLNQDEINQFLCPPDPCELTAAQVGIDQAELELSLNIIINAVKNKESIVVYADYDADGITAGAIMWETLHNLGVRVMPYIPHRVDEGYGLSIKGIDTVISEHHPKLIITVDHGITGREKVDYAKSKGIEVIVTDHHVKPEKIPVCPIVHTTLLSGAGISWFVAKELLNKLPQSMPQEFPHELLELSAIGTIADMVPLSGPNRSIAKYGLAAINSTNRNGLEALIQDAGLEKGGIKTHDISHIIAPRLNAMGRLVHAMDALRLLCTKSETQARDLAALLGTTNKERQQMTSETAFHAMDQVRGEIHKKKKLLFVSHEDYNQGVIGLVAGKLVEEYYLPSIVIARGDQFSKASARSISGFNIVEAIRNFSDILIDVGGHPMAAGFTIETDKLSIFQDKIESYAAGMLTDELLTRSLKIDLQLPLWAITEDLWEQIRKFEPFGMGNYEPVFATKNVKIIDLRLVGVDGKHLKLRISNNDETMQQFNNIILDCIGFGMGSFYPSLHLGQSIDIAYTIDLNIWNGNKKVQLKIKDITY